MKPYKASDKYKYNAKKEIKTKDNCNEKKYIQAKDQSNEKNDIKNIKKF